MNPFDFFQYLEPEEVLLLKLSATLILVSLLFVAIIFANRLYKTWYYERREWFLKYIAPQLNNLAIAQCTPTQWRREVKSLITLIGVSRFRKQVVIDYLLHMKNNLSGESAGTIIRLYRDLNLVMYSREKLVNGNWKEQTEGLRQLAAMNCYFIARMKSMLLTTKNKVLREELLMAMVWLDKDDPFRGFDLIKFKLTNWMKVNIHHQLTKYDKQNLPLFSKWFVHDMDDVVIFFITLTRIFKQTESIPGLVKLLSGKPDVVISALKALIAMEAFNYGESVARLIPDHWENEKLSLLILRYLDKAESSQSVIEMLEHYKTYPSRQVKEKARRALNNLGRTSKTTENHSLAGLSFKLNPLDGYALTN